MLTDTYQTKRIARAIDSYADQLELNDEDGDYTYVEITEMLQELGEPRNAHY